MKKQLIHLFLMAATLASAQEKGLKDYFKDYFPVGVAVSPRLLESAEESNLILREFNSLTAENVMKMGPIHPKPDAYNWGPADKIVQFARTNGLLMRGHTLCWHSQAPNWFFTDSLGKQVDKNTLLERLRAHIFAVAGRYQSDVYAWDVVNEAISDAEEEFYRPSLFYQICGEEYIAKAFEFAHEAAPDALLFYNDYNTENPVKREKIIKMVQELRAKGVPIHGIGLQGHWSIYGLGKERFLESMARYASLGLKLHITELDVSVYPSENGRREKRPDEPDAFTPEMEAQQIEQYRMLFEVIRQYRDHISSVTFWNLSDRSSWLDNFPVRGRKNYPLLFDQQLQRKKAYPVILPAEQQ